MKEQKGQKHLMKKAKVNRSHFGNFIVFTTLTLLGLFYLSAVYLFDWKCV